jgi:hypothetical protein
LPDAWPRPDWRCTPRRSKTVPATPVFDAIPTDHCLSAPAQRVISTAVLANFRMEGQDDMTATLRVIWRIAPLSPPLPIRHCARCGTDRPFQPSGKVRLNANGRKLDAWLIYRCEACDATWNLPLLDRVPVAQVPAADLQAMQSSAPEWVRARLFNAALLRRHADRIVPAAEPAIHRQADGPVPWAKAELLIAGASGDRMDRLLAQGLGLSRSELQALVQAGAVTTRGAWQKPVRGNLTLHLFGAQMTDAQRDRVTSGLIGPTATRCDG